MKIFGDEKFRNEKFRNEKFRNEKFRDEKFRNEKFRDEKFQGFQVKMVIFGVKYRSNWIKIGGCEMIIGKMEKCFL